MFSLNQAPLLCVQLLVIGRVLAVVHPDDRRYELVLRGDSISFDCNTSKADTRQIIWTKDRFLFSYSFLKNLTFSNFTSPRLRIDQNFPSVLNVSDAQHEDAGLYECVVTAHDGPRTTQWNLTVSEKPEEASFPWYFPYILAAVIGLLLCGIAPAVCLCRKLRARTPEQNPAQDQTNLESGGEVMVPQGSRERRTNNKQRSQYMERLNSIYDVY
ncbi:hypothetical protein E3U43_016421 [Larimichthys crocea]|uniref:Uncharacterized protein n=1 Tax=Larimichthys crocea TaxID=215358 RepID=A0ACD3QI02_LARCR|nr:hypothetical protein E3U43_016421 [Larimichthys crocea]